MKYHALFVILKKRQNLKLSSAANYRWRLKGEVTCLHKWVVHLFFAFPLGKGVGGFVMDCN